MIMNGDKYYNQIDMALNDYELFEPYKRQSIDWICQRIDWCWKWRHITEAQKDELCNRIITIMEELT